MLFLNENKEEVEKEKFGWAVLYKDGSELHQFDFETQRHHKFQEISIENVELFVVLPLELVGERIDIPLNKDMQIFYFYRNVKPFYSDKFIRVIVFGWKSKKTNEKNSFAGRKKDY